MSMTARPWIRSAFFWLLAGILVILLAVLATLQYRWIGALSEGERARAQAALEDAARDFAEDFDRLITELFAALVPTPEELRARVSDDAIRDDAIRDDAARDDDVSAPAVVSRLAAWRDAAPYPALLRALYRVRPIHSGTTLERLEEGGFVAAPWPEELRPLERRFAAAGAAGGRASFGRRGRGPRLPFPFPLLLDEIPALVVPEVGAGRGRGRFRPRSRRDPRDPGGNVLVALLDRETIEDRILPELAARHFPEGADGPYPLAVVRREDRAVLYRQATEALPRADAGAQLFALRPPRAFAATWEASERLGAGRMPARWQLIASHPAGSLEETVARTRRRNLSLGLGILALLASSVVFLALAARRSQRLARQQLDFVAGVSHELMTPLAAMRSAGQNLADGVVTDPDQVRRYGALVDREGRRLSSRVEQILAYAGMRAGRAVGAREAVAPAAVIAAAVEEARPLLNERGIEVEVEIDDGVPDVVGDPAALRRALLDLLTNAAKYAADGGWIGVRADVDKAGAGEVRIAVADRGPGIAAEDRARLFEPFYRGRESGGVAGSGLGLALVDDVARAHGGRVTAGARTGGGSVFTLHLPAARGDGNDP